ncbi:MFS transporter [Sinomonas mesophila]|uniref:MFS transporter n=1 Tax=Sinomonas mesophila TaxID=1531955 RepID=UPI001115ACB3|nr:MFS transporter [Sinomonas mesophila]
MALSPTDAPPPAALLPAAPPPAAVAPPPTAARAVVRPTWPVVIAAVLVALNLRPAVTSIAAAFPELGAAFGPAFSAGTPWLLALGSAPVLAFGLSAGLGPWLAARCGLARTLTGAMLALAAALVLRVAAPELLLAGSAAAGIAIMVGSVLVPQLVKAHGGAAWFSGLATMGMGGGAAIGAALLTPSAAAVGLPAALATWAAPAAAAALVVALSLGSRRRAAQGAGPFRAAAPAPDAGRPLLKHPTAVAIAAYFGVQATLYFALTSWLPSFLVSRGAEAAEASALLAWFSVAGLPATLVVPMLLGRRRWRGALGPGIGVVLAASILWVLVAPLPLMPLAIAVLGLAQSGALGYALAMVVVRASGAAVAGRLSALSQGAGFTLAAAGPPAAGAAVQLTGGWTAPFAGMAALALALVWLGVVAHRGREVS